MNRRAGRVAAPERLYTLYRQVAQETEDDLAMTPRELEEYRALRATIRERGTARVWIFVVGLALWAALVLGAATIMMLPEATLLPLLTLAGVFEAVFALHTGVERVGRYIQVFYESESPDQSNWEYTAMAFGRAFSGSASDPLFGRFFWIATALNFIPAILAGAIPVEWIIIGLAHVVFIVRVAAAERHAARQRALDLDHFQKLKAAGGPAIAPERS
jgi:hypothetical protein